MECFNCNKKATTKLSIEPDVGEIYTCSSQSCKDKVKSDIKRFENQTYRQGRRKDQVELVEKTLAWCLITFIMATAIVGLISIINKL